MNKTLKNDLLEKFNELYYFEFQRKDSINSGSNFLLALSTIYGSIIVFYLNSLPLLEISLKSISFYILLVGSLVFFCLSLIHFRKFLSGRDYQYISYPNEILEYLKELSEYNRKAEIGEESDIEEEFLDMMLNQTSESAKINSKANTNKVLSYNNTVRFLLISLLLLLITSVPFFINKYQDQYSTKKETTISIQENPLRNG
jgi:hypothetical protein